MLIDKYYKYLKDNNLNKVVISPKSMIIENTEDTEGWMKWKTVKSNINDRDIKKLETKFNFLLPEEYLNFIKYKQFMDIQIGKYRIFGVNEFNTLEKIISMFPNNVIALGFIPIGSMNDTDFLALNVKSGEVVSLAYEDYRLKEVLFSSFHEFEIFLSNNI